MGSGLTSFVKRGVIIIIACWLWQDVPAQINPFRQAIGRMEDGKWDNARQLLAKALKKDTVSIEVQWLLSVWFGDTRNPGFHIDSAYHYATVALQNYSSLDARTRDRLKKFPIDSLLLLQRIATTDSLAFDRARQTNTELAYGFFIDRYPNSTYRTEAVELRDEVCFLEALKQNTEQSYQRYLMQYPASKRATEAKSRYDKLVYTTRTRDGKLSSFRAFAATHPESPFIHEVHQQIFEMSTATGNADAFISFFQQYPTSRYGSFSRDLAFHVLKDSGAKLADALMTDSLREVQTLEAAYWVPYFKNGKFGFMDATGTERLSARFDQIDEAYLCGNVTAEILNTQEGLVARSGKKISPAVDAVNDLGAGFLTLKRGSCETLIHKSGKPLLAECHASIQLLVRKFIKAQVGAAYDLFALNGKKLTSGWQDISEKEGLLIFTQQGKQLLALPEQVAALAEGMALPTSFVFDHISAFENKQILVRNGALEGVLDNQLNWLVPLARQTLQPTPVGILRKQNDYCKLGTIAPELEKLEVKKITFSDRWLVLEEETTLKLFDLNLKKIIVPKSDSIWFDRNMAFARLGDSTSIYFQGGSSLNLKNDAKINFITARDTVTYFFTEAKGKKTVFNILTGKKLFTIEFDEIVSLGNDLFQITRKQKKYLAGREGKPIIADPLDQIVKTNAHQVALLKDKKFGLYDITNRLTLLPEYERNVELVPGLGYIVYKNGKATLINAEKKSMISTEADDIKPWTSQAVWIKQGAYWALLDIPTGKLVVEKIRTYSIISSDLSEKLALIQKENFYGVLSSTRGIVIAPTFHDVMNVGSDELPFYFTEKKVEEAGIHVVLYFTHEGKLVRKLVLEDEEYEKLYCGN